MVYSAFRYSVFSDPSVREHGSLIGNSGHYLTRDRLAGGHVLDFSPEHATVEVISRHGIWSTSLRGAKVPERIVGMRPKSD